MAISARSALLVLLGLVPLAFAPSRAFAWAWFGVVVAVCLLDVLGAPSPRSLRLSREVSGPIRADQSTEATVRLTNTTKRHMLLDVRDAWPPSLRPAPSRHRIRLRPGHSERVSTTLSPTRRGTRHADMITIRSWGPLHLGARQVSFEAPVSLSALPEFKARVLLPSRLARLHELEGTTPTTLRGAGTEFDSLRAYVIGDDPRDIDWRASARSTELMVRQWRPERDRHVLIVVDCGRASSALLGAPEHEEVDSIALGRAPRLDSSIETALLLAALADRAGDKVHVLALDSQVRARRSSRRSPALSWTSPRAWTLPTGRRRLAPSSKRFTTRLSSWSSRRFHPRAWTRTSPIPWPACASATRFWWPRPAIPTSCARGRAVTTPRRSSWPRRRLSRSAPMTRARPMCE